MRLVDRNPQISAQEMLSELVPPREFSISSFENYLPDVRFPSQANAVRMLQHVFTKSKSKREASTAPGVYLDGGFGVGKTHLLASLYRIAPGRKLFGSFLAYTGVIGAIGFAETLKLLKKYDFIAIDEFELDDPGNTMILSRLINELSSAGVFFAATSNTPPDALGAGRFAAEDFQREILGIGAKFQVVSIDGEDYRHRHLDSEIPTASPCELASWAGDEVTSSIDDFDDLLKHLAGLHPSKYHKLIHGIERVAIRGVDTLVDQADALRFVALVDRAYENQTSIRNSGISFSALFPEEMLKGGYQKKYRRALSRLASMH